MFVSDWTQSTQQSTWPFFFFFWLSCKFCIMPIASLKTIDTVGDNDSSTRCDEWVPTRKQLLFFFAKHSGSVGEETDINNWCVKQTPTTRETRYVAQRLRPSPSHASERQVEPPQCFVGVCSIRRLVGPGCQSDSSHAVCHLWPSYGRVYFCQNKRYISGSLHSVSTVPHADILLLIWG